MLNKAMDGGLDAYKQWCGSAFEKDQGGQELKRLVAIAGKHLERKKKGVEQASPALIAANEAICM